MEEQHSRLEKGLEHLMNYNVPRITSFSHFIEAPAYTRRLEADAREFQAILECVRSEALGNRFQAGDVSIVEFEAMLCQMLHAIEFQHRKYSAIVEALSALRDFTSIVQQRRPQAAYSIFKTFYEVWPDFLEEAEGPLRDQLGGIVSILAFESDILESRPDILLSPNRRFSGKKTYKIKIETAYNLQECNFNQPFLIEAMIISGAIRVLVCGVVD